MKPFFSIVIPTLNEEQFLPHLLSCLTRQKKKNFEIIIVDGNSEDKTPSIIENNAKKLPILFKQVTKRNVSYQRNYGASLAQGVYLIFFDADVSISPHFTQNLEKNIKKKNGLIFINYVVPREKKAFQDIRLLFPLVNKLVEFSHVINKPFSAGGNMVWEKNVFSHIGGFDESIIIAEDHDIIRRAHRFGLHTKFLPNPKIRFSLRRMKREGRLNLFYKIIRSHIHLLFNERINKKMFNYDMGGHLYAKTYIKSNQFVLLNRNLKKIASSSKKIFNTLINS